MMDILEWRAQLHDRLAADPGPKPKFATPPDLSRPSLGRRQDQFAKFWLGQPLMPWQLYVADVSSEMVIDPETGIYVPAHPLGVITVQRQAGKSHLCMTSIGERCLECENYRSWYTAQTGGDARDQFLKFNDEVVAGTLLESVIQTLRGNGREVMNWPNGSTVRPYAPTDKGLHGKQTDRNDMDEGWAFTRERGKVLLQGSGPTGLTRSQSQNFIWSAGGTEESTWLADYVARGRAGDPSLFYLEHGVPDDLEIAGDLTDEVYQAIAEHHPAYGHTITVAALKKLRSLFPDDDEYARAAGNRWTGVIGGTINAKTWESLRHPDPIPHGARVGYGAARAADGTEVAIVVAADLGEFVVVEVLDVIAPHGAAPAVDAWTNDALLAVDPVGPSTNLHDELTTRGRDLAALTTRHVGAAVANLMDAFPGRRVRFRRHPALDAAVKVAGTRPSGDGGKLWARVAAGASIATLEAATLAVWALSHHEEDVPAPPPLFDFGDDAA